MKLTTRQKNTLKKYFLEWVLPTTWRTVVKIDIANLNISKHKLLKNELLKKSLK